MPPKLCPSAVLILLAFASSGICQVNRQIVFESNSGQARPEIVFRSRGAHYGVDFHSTGWVITTASTTGRNAIQVSLLGASRTATLEGAAPSLARINYLIGPDPSRWTRQIPTQSRIRYRGIYPGIDIVFYGNEGSLEYDFVVAPNADPSRIKLLFSGAKRLSVSSAGELLIDTGASVIRQVKPVVYQEHGGRRIPLSGQYRVRGNQASFQLDRYDRSRTLVIDPTLVFATYLGGNGQENPRGLAVDSAGNIYVSGDTLSPNFPTKGATKRTKLTGADNIYISKFNGQGQLVYSTYLGGTGTDTAGGIGVDSAGNAYVTGYTNSSDFPMMNAYQGVNHGGATGLDVFVSKLNAAGSDLLYSTYLGGNNDDLADAIAVDAAGNAYITGTTASLNYPLSANAFQSSTIGYPTMVTKLSPSGGLSYSTLVGGSGVDFGFGIAVDSAGNAFVTGATTSTDFPLANLGYQKVNHGGPSLGTDAFVYKLNPTGTGVVWSTYLGGGGDDYGFGVAVDGKGNTYVTGSTASSDFPATAGVIQTALSGPTDAFIAKLDPTGANLVYSTYFGGSRDDRANVIVADSFGDVYVAGLTTSTNLEMVAPSQATIGGANDAFVLKLNPTATAILQSSYFGGTNNDSALSAALDPAGAFYVYGFTSSSGIATVGASQGTYGGGSSDAFLAKFDFNIDLNALTFTPATFTFQGNTGAAIADQQLSISGVTGVNAPWTVDAETSTGGAWLAANPKSGSGAATVALTMTTAGLAAGNYAGSLTVTDQANGSKTTIPVSLALSTPGGTVSRAGVVNAASFVAGPVSPGMVVTIFGSNIGPAKLAGAQLDSSGKLATLIADTQILFDNTAAPLVYASAGQVSAIVPYEVTGHSTQMQAIYQGLKSAPVTLNLTAAAPAIFTANSSGKGQGAILNQDNSYNSSGNPAAKGSIVVLYVTGEGETTPVSIDGQIANDIYPKPNLPVTVQIGGVAADVKYYGAAPGLTAGVMQVNAQVPEGVASGNVPITVTVGTTQSPAGVTVAVR